MVIIILLVLVFLCGHVWLFYINRWLAIMTLFTQITVMFFVGVLLLTIDLNYPFTLGNKDLTATLLVVCELLLLFVPWYMVYKKVYNNKERIQHQI